jgi:hypothetical protein
MRLGIGAVFGVLLALCISCSTTESPDSAPVAGNSNGVDRAASPASERNPDSSDGRAATERAVLNYIQAVNAGDRAKATAAVAENARFDIAGRVLQSRAEIMDNFLFPEVIGAGGHYQALGSRWERGRLIVDYEFTTRSGGQESFHYSYLTRDGRIQELVGRYN